MPVFLGYDDGKKNVKQNNVIENLASGLSKLINHFRNKSRLRRIELFRQYFKLTPETRLLDLGGWNGSHVNALIGDTPINRSNVFVADIDAKAILSAQQSYGFTPLLTSENEQHLNFPDGYFDIVFCSSVIEHVTVPKSEIWDIADDDIFRNRAVHRQAEFAKEIRRLGKSYYVQVPYRMFPIETHSWMPYLAQLPRKWQIRAIKLTNKYWIKKTSPDFYLPTEDDMRLYFPDAKLHWETLLGLKKSIIAIRV